MCVNLLFTYLVQLRKANENVIIENCVNMSEFVLTNHYFRAIKMKKTNHFSVNFEVHFLHVKKS